MNFFQRLKKEITKASLMLFQEFKQKKVPLVFGKVLHLVLQELRLLLLDYLQVMRLQKSI